MKFLYGCFNQETGQSIVAIADKHGRYIGYARLHPEDKKYASKYTGCAIAEGRAWIKALKNQKRYQKYQLKIIENLSKDIKLNCSSSCFNETLKRFNLESKKCQKNIEEIDENIKQIQNKIDKRIEIRNNLIKNNKNYLV